MAAFDNEKRWVAPGEWVATSDPGIWQVYRIEAGFYEDRFSLDEPKEKSRRTIVFARRIVGANWKRSFATGSWEASLVEPLSEEDGVRLSKLLAEDPELAADFQRYVPEPLDLITNLSFGLPTAFSQPRLEEICRDALHGISRGMSLDEVLKVLGESDLAQYFDTYPISATIQLVSPDHQRRGDEFVHTAYRILDY